MWARIFASFYEYEKHLLSGMKSDTKEFVLRFSQKRYLDAAGKNEILEGTYGIEMQVP